MTKKTAIISIITIVLWAGFIAYSVFANNTPTEKIEDRSLWMVAEELNDLRTMKQECLDNLSYLDTIKQAKGYTWFCDSWDEEIISVREELKALQEKPYDKAVGLVQSR